MEGNDDLQAVVKRYAFLVMRISMIQTRIRQFEANDLSPEIYCIDADFERSLQIVLCCYEHSRLLHSSFLSSEEFHGKCKSEYGWGVRSRNCLANCLSVREYPSEDTEAQTLSTANHLDCGNFDDMLRKAFEHENIGESVPATA